jgi:ATP-independent RNA helicase DbpA
LRPELLEALLEVGYTQMTPIQAETLPTMLANGDVTGQAKTGSGKTAAFGLALLNKLDTERAEPQALVLCPTRELAEQVAAELRRLAQRMANTRVLTLCGGRPAKTQRASLGRASQLVVGTPGRIGDHLRNGALNLDALQVLVLDEADRMLDMGFLDEVQSVVDQCPAERQTLLFSATFPPEIDRLRHVMQQDSKFVAVESLVEPGQLRQLVFECGPGQRQQLVVDLLAAYRPDAALVFCETRDDTEQLCSYLADRGAVALALHGKLDQRERDDALLQLAHRSATVLVATDIAARGLDIPSLPVVIVSELSRDPENHVHRIGRTGRAGETGLALSIMQIGERRRLDRIESFMDLRIERGPKPQAVGKARFPKPPNRTLMLLAGRNEKLRKGDVLGALVKDGNLPPEAIGRIDLMQHACAVAVARVHAQEALEYIRRGRIKKKRVRALLLGES